MRKLALVTLLLLSLGLIAAMADEPILDKFVYLPLVSKSVPTPTEPPPPTNTPAPVPTARPTPTTPPYDCSSDLYNCSDFSTRVQAQTCYDYCIAGGYGDVHDLDRDNDGIACEELPNQ